VSFERHYPLGDLTVFFSESQNSAIDKHKVTGVKIPLVALGINNGWVSSLSILGFRISKQLCAAKFDATIQYKAYIDYALSNPYRALISNSQATSYLSAYNNNCLPALNTCSKSPSDSHCSNADGICVNYIENPIVQDTNFDPYYIPSADPDQYPPKTYVTYLQSKNIMNAIGAQSQYTECSNPAYQEFSKTGDCKFHPIIQSIVSVHRSVLAAMSLLSTLSEVVQSGIQVLIWAGDAGTFPPSVRLYRFLTQLSHTLASSS
jgi:Serine carboxypeptidase